LKTRTSDRTVRVRRCVIDDAILPRCGLFGAEGGQNLDARRQQIQIIRIVGEARHSIVVINGADRDGGGNAGWRAQAISETVIARGDDDSDAGIGQRVHAGLNASAKAGRTI
jgi:hypothetical protein